MLNRGRTIRAPAWKESPLERGVSHLEDDKCHWRVWFYKGTWIQVVPWKRYEEAGIFASVWDVSRPSWADVEVAKIVHNLSAQANSETFVTERIIVHILPAERDLPNL